MYGVKCSKCGMEVGFIRELSGKQVSCPRCGQAFVMREPGDDLPRLIVPDKSDVLPPARSVVIRRSSRSLLSRIPRAYRIPIAAGACILLLGVVARGRVFDGFLPDPAAPRVIHDFRGTGNAQTPVFTVRNDWGIEWDVRGSLMFISVCDPARKVHPDDPERNIVESFPTNGLAQGKAIRYKGGRYFLKTYYAEGPWRIRVLQYPGRL